MTGNSFWLPAKKIISTPAKVNFRAAKIDLGGCPGNIFLPGEGNYFRDCLKNRLSVAGEPADKEPFLVRCTSYADRATLELHIVVRGSLPEEQYLPGPQRTDGQGGQGCGPEFACRQPVCPATDRDQRGAVGHCACRNAQGGPRQSKRFSCPTFRFGTGRYCDLSAHDPRRGWRSSA